LLARFSNGIGKPAPQAFQNKAHNINQLFSSAKTQIDFA
jgi:hypothetical protein